MRAPQYQIVAVKGLIETKEEYQVRVLWKIERFYFHNFQRILCLKM